MKNFKTTIFGVGAAVAMIVLQACEVAPMIITVVIAIGIAGLAIFSKDK